MFLFHTRYLNNYFKKHGTYGKKVYALKSVRYQTTKPLETKLEDLPKTSSLSIDSPVDRIERDILPAARMIPMIVDDKEPVVLPFNEVPGPKALKYLSTCRYYLSEIGTQMTAGLITVGLNMKTYINQRKPIRNLSTLFDEYGPVVRYVSPVGADIVLLNHPDHIQKVFSLEGDNPVRSTLESLEKYRMERRSHGYGGLYTVHGNEWIRQRSVLDAPVRISITKQTEGMVDVCDKFTQKVYKIRNYQDEITKDLYEELHKWAFDIMGLVMFSKNFSMLEKDFVYSQCDVSWMYHSLERATHAILKCETGLHLWKLFSTPAWYNLVKYCDNLDSLIGKHVLETEQSISKDDNLSSLTSAMLLSDQNLKTEDIVTILMDIMLIGVNTVTSTMSFLLYYLAKHTRVQKILYKEIAKVYRDTELEEITSIRSNTPYLQACLKETLRLVPPIPLITRILPKNITLDRYNIPRGTLLIMSTQDASLKESNYDEANKFYPERWLVEEAKEYHEFASIPFGFGTRKCLGQNIAETMLTLLTIRVLQRYKLEYHYGDVQPTRNFIVRPNKLLKIRFIDRI